MTSDLGRRAVLLAILLSAAACAPRRTVVHVMRESTPCPPPPITEPLPSLGHDRDPTSIEALFGSRFGLRSGENPTRSFRIERERSGTQETLRAVIAEDDQPPLAIGDHGVAMTRDRVNGWRKEDTGTIADLFAVARAPSVPSAPSAGREGKAIAFVAVGAGGVARRRDPDGTWHPEDTGTTADLHAIWGGSVAVGAGGVMVARSPEGRWRNVPTWTKANLHGVGLCAGHVCAVGEGGVIVDCAYPSREPVCVPRRPRTEAPLRVLTGEVLILGEGVWLGIAPWQEKEPSPPPDWMPWRHAGPTVSGTDARAAARNSWLGESLVVGRHGAVWSVGNSSVTDQPVHKMALPYTVDFHGVTYSGADGFIVGAEGTILKLGVQQLQLPRTCLL